MSTSRPADIAGDVIAGADAPQVAEDWLAAFESAEICLHHLRAIYPSMMFVLPETGHEAVRRAMQEVQDGVVSLHRAGRHVLGVEQYERFVVERAEECARDRSARGDQDG